MQKKILASLLVAPVAFNALADITVEPSLVTDNTSIWGQSGITGDVKVFNGEGVQCPIGTGKLTRTLNKLNPGTYTITLADANNVMLSVTVPGSAAKTSATGSIEFTVAAENTDVELLISAVDASTGFSFTKADLVLKVNFADIAAKLQEQLGEVTLDDVVEEDDRQEAKDLRAEKSDYEIAIAKIKGEIASLSGEEIIELYNQFQLWKGADGNTIAVEIADLKAKADGYNKRVAAENQIWQNIVDNKATLADFNAAINTLQESLDKAKTDRAALETTPEGHKYIDGATQAEIDRIQAEITAYQAAVTEAFKDLTVDPATIKVEDQTDAIQKDIDALNGLINKAFSDWKAYTALMNLQSELTNTASTVTDALGALKGVEGQEENFSDYITGLQNQVNEIYNKAMTDVEITPGKVEGAHNAQMEDTKILANAQMQIEDILAQAQQHVGDQNKWYTDAQEKVDALQQDLLSTMGLLYLPEDEAKEFQKLYNDALEAIKNFNEAIDAAYKDGTVKEDYTTELGKVEEAVQAVKDFNAKWEPICVLFHNLDELKVYVAKLQADSKVPTTEFNLDAKFAGTYLDLNQAITDLFEKHELPVAQPDIDKVQKAIDDAKVSAKNLMDAYVAVSTDVKAFDALIKELEENVAAKLRLTGNTWTPETFTSGKVYTDLKAKYDEFVAALNGVKAAEAQAAYDQAVALKGAIDEYGVEENVDNAIIAFEDPATNGNHDAVKAAIDAVRTFAETGEYEGKDDVSFTDLDDALAAIKTRIEAALAAEDPDYAVFTKIDNDLKDLLVKVDAKKAEIQALKDNQAAYDQLNADLIKLPDGIKELIEYNQNNSLVPARDYFDNLIQGEQATSLQSRYDALAAELDKALTDHTAATNKEALQAKIDTLKQDIENMRADITANNTNNINLLATSDYVRDAINGYIKAITNDDTDHNTSELTKEWRDKLNVLVTDSLSNIDIDVNKYYGVGKLADSKVNQGLVDRYNDILAKAKVIFDDYVAGIGDAVSRTNDATVREAGWTGKQTAMDEAFNSAVNQYNAFFGLTNKEYREFILKVVRTHEPIFQYYGQIRTLEGEVQKFITDNNKEQTVFTADEFNAAATDKADALIAEIQGKVDLMLADAAAAAKAYYAGGSYTYHNPMTGEEITGVVAEGIHTAATDVVSTAEETMTQAGITDPVLADALKIAKGYLSTGEVIYKDNENAKLLGLQPMDNIANNFDKISGSIDMQQAAHDQWDADYADAEKELAELDKKLKDVTDETTANLRETMAGYISEAAALDTEADADSNLLDNLKSDQEKLQDILDKAKALYDEAKAKYDKDQANQQQKDDFNAEIGTLRDKYEELVKFADSLAGGDSMSSTLDGIKGQIDNIDKLVNETYQASLTEQEHKDEIQAAIDTAKGDILAAYRGVKDNEIVALNDLLSKTKVAFDNVKVSGNLSEEWDALNAEILKYQNDIVGLHPIAVPDKKDDFQSTAAAVEQGLSDLYVKLMSNYTEPDGGSPMPGITEGLQQQYDAVAAAIAAGQEYLDGCFDTVKSEYTDDYTALSEKLDAVKTAWEAEGNKLVLTHEAFASQLDALLAEVKALGDQVKDAQDQAQAEKDRIDANNAAYTDLKGQLDAFQERLDSIMGVITDNELTQGYDSWAKDIQGYIKSDEDWLETANGNVALTADSKLPYGEFIADQLDWLQFSVENSVLSKAESSCETDLLAANAAVNQRVVPDIQQDLQEQLQGLIDQFNETKSDVSDSTSKYLAGELTLEELIAKYHEAADTYAELSTAAQEIASQADENVFTPGDVTLDTPATVDATDLQTLIGWIGQGVTYDELYAESRRKAAAADMTGDKEINIADATSLIQVILDESDQAAPAPRRMLPRSGVQTGQSKFAVAMLTNEGGVRTYGMSLYNAETFVGGQIDINLPAGMTLTDATAESRAAGHQVIVFDNGGGHYRLVVISMSNEVISGNDGILLQFTTEGIGTPEVENVVFADTEMNSVKVTKADQSMIESIMNSATNMKDRIYNVAGQTMRSIQRGINIIRHNDGTSSKELH